jgi:hypothetical protein
MSKFLPRIGAAMSKQRARAENQKESSLCLMKKSGTRYSLPADSIQRFLRPGESSGHRKRGAIFLGGGLLVALFF